MQHPDQCTCPDCMEENETIWLNGELQYCDYAEKPLVEQHRTCAICNISQPLSEYKSYYGTGKRKHVLYHYKTCNKCEPYRPVYLKLKNQTKT